jgi:hypothetical protein
MAKKVNLDVSEKLDITCRKGDTFSLTLTLKDSDGVALPLATDNYSFVMQVRDSATSAVSKGASGLILGTKGVGSKAVDAKGQERSFETFVVDDSGNVTITATAATMREVPAGSYIYDIQQIKPNTTTGVDVHSTILKGNFRVNQDISEAVQTDVGR